MIKKSIDSSIPDIQNSGGFKPIDIDYVGVKSVRYPIVFRDHIKDQSGWATFSIFSSLSKNHRGMHMSRCIEVLESLPEFLSVENYCDLIELMKQSFGAIGSFISMQFFYFRYKTSPVSQVKSYMDYQVTLSAQQSMKQSDFFKISVIIPVTSLCPCSRDVSDYGAHNQRSSLTLTVQPVNGHVIEVYELIDIAESQASSQLYALLKRADEKFVTEYAYNHPRFVEDIVRNIADILAQDVRIHSYCIESEHFESIHNHSAYARIESVS